MSKGFPVKLAKVVPRTSQARPKMAKTRMAADNVKRRGGALVTTRIAVTMLAMAARLR